MSEFELSTLIMVVMLLVALGGYSYWQIARAQNAQRKTIEQEDQAYLDEIEAEIGDDDLPLVLTKSKPKAEYIVSNSYASAVVPEPRSGGSTSVMYQASQIDSEFSSEAVVFEESFTRVVLKDAPAHKPAVIPVIVDEPPAELKVEQPVNQELFETPAIEPVQITEATAIPEHAEMAENQPVIQTELQATAIAPQEAIIEPVSAVAQTEESEKPVHAPSQSAAILGISESADPQFFNKQDLTEQASIKVFDPLIRLASWVDSAQPQPINGIDGIIDVIVNQPKNTQDIEKALVDLRLDTDLPLRLFGLRAGQIAPKHSDDTNAARNWQPLETGVLYSGLRLTLQLANASTFASTALIFEWYELVQHFAKRLASHVSVWPDADMLANQALYLHDVSKRLSAPLVVQLRKPQGLWAGYEVHQQMTQWGLQLDNNGHYIARHTDGRVLYRVINDLTNPRAQDFHRDGLASMHVQTLSFCIDLAHVPAAYLPEQRMWHDLSQVANALQATWCNEAGDIISAETLFAHAAEHVPEYLRQINALGVPAGSLLMRRLMQKNSK